MFSSASQGQKIFRTRRKRETSDTMMLPWLAGARYRTTAVVLVYRLISLIGPHCPASTYSSTYPSSNVQFVVDTEEKGERRSRGGAGREGGAGGGGGDQEGVGEGKKCKEEKVRKKDKVLTRVYT